MRKKIIVVMFSILFFIPTISGLHTVENIRPSNSKTIYVDDDGGADYKTINEAIDAADNGDTIFVYNGLYSENISINKPLILIGENKTETIIDGYYNDYVVNIIVDDVNLKNFTIRNSGGFKENAGLLINSDYNQISSCNFYRAKSGILIEKSNYNEINNCTFYSNGQGIWINNSSNTRIIDNVFYHNAFGLVIQNSDFIELISSYIQTSSIGLVMMGSSHVKIKGCAIYNNNDNGGGNFIDNCQNIEYSNCIVNHNGFGIIIANSTEISIKNCDLVWNEHTAIQIKEKAKDIIIDSCEISRSFRFAIDVNYSICKISNCNLYRNLFGILADKSFCDARKNWWGSPFGPGIFERRIKDKIKAKWSFIRIIPWKILRNKNAGADWEIDYNRFSEDFNASRFKQIQLPGNDSDNDFVPDWWEIKWGYDENVWNDHANLDPDEDGLNNIEECYTDQWNSSPYKKDIFIEFDWMQANNPNNKPNKPADEYIEEMIQVFSQHDITLHMDNGSLGGGEEVPFKSHLSLVDIRDYYWNNFLHNDLNNPRKGIFRYCFISDYGPEPGFPGYSNFGWDNLDSFEISAELVSRNHQNKPREYIIISITMHELGHTLGLFVDDHGGIDNEVATILFTKQLFKYLRYRSIMNYQFTYYVLDYSDGHRGRNDFDDWGNLDFNFFKNTQFEWPKDGTNPLSI